MPSSAIESVLRASISESVKQAGCVQSSAIRSVLQSVFGSVERSAFGSFVECSR